MDDMKTRVGGLARSQPKRKQEEGGIGGLNKRNRIIKTIGLLKTYTMSVVGWKRATVLGLARETMDLAKIGEIRGSARDQTSIHTWGGGITMGGKKKDQTQSK